MLLFAILINHGWNQFNTVIQVSLIPAQAIHLWCSQANTYSLKKKEKNKKKLDANSTTLISPNLQVKPRQFLSLLPSEPLTGLRGALAAQLCFRLAVADGGDVLAALHGGVPSCGVRARWLLDVLHFHLLVVYPQIRRSQVLLAALPFTSAVSCTFPAAKKDQNCHVRTFFPFIRPKEWCLLIGVSLRNSSGCVLQRTVVILVWSYASRSLLQGMGLGHLHQLMWKLGKTTLPGRERKCGGGFISGRAALVERLHLQTATENCWAHVCRLTHVLHLP